MINFQLRVSQLIVWEKNACCFVFIVDCQPLADVMNGKAPLKAPGLAPVFERLTSRLFDMLQSGWGLHTQTADPISWQRRSFNKVADYLLNYTMDSGCDWLQIFDVPVSDFRASMANFMCHSDSGTRQGSCSGIGWHIEALISQDGAQRTFPVAVGGKFMKTPISSFTTQLLALDDVINHLSNIVLRKWF